MDKQYVIYNFINEYLEGYFDSGMPSLTCFNDCAMKMNYSEANANLVKLHAVGFTGLQIKEYDAGLFD